jgi:hypothetical protein
MPIWAATLEASLYALTPVFAYWYIKYCMACSKFKRTYDIAEGANSWDRCDELRAINREIARAGKWLIFVTVVLLIIAGSFTYFYATPHSKGLI